MLLDSKEGELIINIFHDREIRGEFILTTLFTSIFLGLLTAGNVFNGLYWSGFIQKIPLCATIIIVLSLILVSIMLSVLLASSITASELPVKITSSRPLLSGCITGIRKPRRIGFGEIIIDGANQVKYVPHKVLDLLICTVRGKQVEMLDGKQ